MIIGNRYFLDNPEYGWYEVSGKYYKEHTERFEKFHKRFINPDSKLKAGIILVSVRPPGDEDDDQDFKQIWKDAVDEPTPRTKSGLYTYFTPAIQPLIDKYGNSNTSNDGSNNDTRKD